jgi:hypothetical protein
MNTTESDLPSFLHPSAAKIRPDLDLMADLLAGTRQMQAKARERAYIRKWDKEPEVVYDIRRQCETVFEGLGRTLSAATGMLFARPPQVAWNQSETAMEEQWQNLDGQGTAGVVLAKRFSEMALRDGLAVLLVDHPAPPEGIAITRANEISLGLRPIWALYGRRQVLSWRSEVIGGALTITQIVLKEAETEPVGAFGVREVSKYRVLRLVPIAGDATSDTTYMAVWELWRETDEQGQGGFAREAQGVFRNRGTPLTEGATLGTLPIAVAYTGRTDSPLSASIPLLGVAWANLSHWRTSTDLAFARMIAAYAQPVVTGELMPSQGLNGAQMPGKIELGPLVAIQLATGGKFTWAAPPTEAFAGLERGAAEKLDQMGAMGASFLIQPHTRGVQTAEAKRLDATAENSTLATAAQGIEDALNGGLELHAWYLGIEKAGAPVITINKDFDSVAIDAPTMVAYVTAVQNAGLPPRILLQAWQQGGRLPADTDLDQLEAEMMANAQTQADAAALAAAEAAKATPPVPPPAP